MSRFDKSPIAPPAGGGAFSGAALAEHVNALVAAIVTGHFDADLPEGADKGLIRSRPAGDDVELVIFDGVSEHVFAVLDGVSGDLKIGDSVHLGDGGALTDQVGSLVAGQAFANRILNGDFAIDRDGGSTKTPGIGVYTFDIWKGHANGLEQVVEALPAGSYTLVFDGGGVGQVGGQLAKASPALFSVVAPGNISVVVPATANQVMLLPGDHTGAPDLPFSARPRQLEELLLGRYYLPRIRLSANGYALSSGDPVRCQMSYRYPIRMRAAPALTYTSYFKVNVEQNPTGGLFEADSAGFSISPAATAGPAPTAWSGTVDLDARL